MTFRPVDRLNERSYTNPAERQAFIEGYGEGYNCNEPPVEPPAYPNAWFAGFWTGVGDMEVKR